MNADRPLEQVLRELGDEFRAVAEMGLLWAKERPHDAERWQHVRGLAARLFAIADVRSGEEIEKTLFEQITHLAPVPVTEGAVFDDDGRVLLIQRADDRLWALPGGAYDVGETPAEGVIREVREETGYLVRPERLLAVFDSRLWRTRGTLQLFMLVFECSVEGTAEASTPHEVLDIGWFQQESLPPLSPGHHVRVPQVFGLRGRGECHFDPPQ